MAFDILPHRAATTIRLEPVEVSLCPTVLFRIVDDSLRARELCFCLCDAVRRLRRGRRGSVAVAVCASRSDLRVGRQSGDRLWRSSLPRRHERNSLGPCDRHGCTCRYGHFHYRPTIAAAKWHARRPRLRSDRRLCGLRTRAFGGNAPLRRCRWFYDRDRWAARRSERLVADRFGCGLRSVPAAHVPAAAPGILSCAANSRRQFGQRQLPKRRARGGIGRR